ncbi:MAG: energy-coupling factor transporter transmembrane protein EcfT [Clostridia bacterium]|nr:energy-coupling factor transporter transmembrane protein EcfT [Clostridia bacterium]
MSGISFGQYYPARSLLHRLDPRIKIILTLLYIICSFMCKNIISYALLLFSAIILVIIGRVPVRIILKGLKGVLFILLFTAVLNIFWTTGDSLLWQWKFISIYAEGLYAALFIMIRISVLIIGTGMLLTYTTTPIALTNAIEDLLSPLKKLHVPVHSFAMMMTIALRFIPTLSEECERIMTAQKARGADFSSGGLIQRAKALIPVLIPLFVSAFNRAGDLATAMECRCYNGGEGRTRMNVRHLRFVDFIPLIVIIAFGAGLITLNILGIGYTA